MAVVVAAVAAARETRSPHPICTRLWQSEINTAYPQLKRKIAVVIWESIIEALHLQSIALGEKIKLI